MEKLRLNKTPIRTCVNFGINDIVLEGFTIPEEISKFDSVIIKNGEAKISTKDVNKETSLTYGVNPLMEEQVSRDSNQSYKIVLDEKTKEYVELVFDFNEKNYSLVDYIEIIAKEGSNGTIVLKYIPRDNEQLQTENYHNGICKIVAKKDSHIQVILVNLLDHNARNFISIEGNVEESAKLDLITIDFGGKSSITNYYLNLEQMNAEGSMKSIYLGKDNQKIDINYIARLSGEKSHVDIDVQGALKDQATKSFKGTLDFKTGAKKAKGNENEFCLLLSDKAKSKALPMLLCTEEDVEGNHSSASGKVDVKELFYLMSRGFSKKEAMKLLVKAKFSHIIDEIESEELKDEILAEIDKRLE